MEKIPQKSPPKKKERERKRTGGTTVPSPSYKEKQSKMGRLHAEGAPCPPRSGGSEGRKLSKKQMRVIDRGRRETQT